MVWYLQVQPMIDQFPLNLVTKPQFKAFVAELLDQFATNCRYDFPIVFKHLLNFPCMPSISVAGKIHQSADASWNCPKC